MTAREGGSPPGARALVLGGTGFIGSHVCEMLCAGGARVQSASRGGRWPWGDRPPRIECHTVDLTEPGSEARLRELLVDTSLVVHLAGALLRASADPAAYRRLHVDGTSRVVAALEGADPAAPVRLVHVSTTGVLGPTGPSARHEDTPPAPTTVYESTKLEGERIALAARRPGVEVVVVRPGLVYGPRDLHLLALFRSIDGGTFRPVAGGRARWQPIHVRDVARAVGRAAEHPGADGKVFHVAGAETVTVRELADRIAAGLGTRVRGPGLPYGLAVAVGAMMELGCRPFAVDPPLSRSRVRTLTEDRLYDIDRAQTVLGFEPRTLLEEGLEETIAWYRDHGHLPAGGGEDRRG